MNIAVVVGTLRVIPEMKPVAGEEVLVVFDVDVFDESGRKSTVPVSWRGLQGDMAPELLDLDIGDDVVVSGVMGRRFIGASGFLVDVRADEVVGGGKVRRRNAVKRVLTAALDAA